MVPDQEQDRNDAKQWSAADIEDLALALKDGGTIEGAAFFPAALARLRTCARRQRSLA